jgi:dihydropteroate synthase
MGEQNQQQNQQILLFLDEKKEIKKHEELIKKRFTIDDSKLGKYENLILYIKIIKLRKGKKRHKLKKSIFLDSSRKRIIFQMLNELKIN